MSNQLLRSNAPIIGFLAGGFLLGALAWSGYFYALALLLLFPLALKLANNRDELIAVVTGYHSGATWTMVPGAQMFFGHHFHPLNTLLLWFALVAILSAPYFALRPSGGMRLAWGLPVILICTGFLPTGIANPLTASGVLFPGTAWFGLALSIALFSAITVWPNYFIPAALALSLVCHVSANTHNHNPEDWAAINTMFGGTGFGDPSIMKRYADAEHVQQAALDSTSRVTVFPESVIYHWNSATDLLWQPTFSELQHRRHVVLIGASEAVPGTKKYRNVLLIRGGINGKFQQRVPLPYAMWRPFSTDGVELNMFGASTITIGKDRVAPLICYEQLLLYPVLSSMIHQPTVLVGVANDYWARGTSIPEIQRAALMSWARLFGIPYVSAVNQ